MFVVTLSKASVKKLGVGAMCCALVVFSAMLGRYISTRSVAVAAASNKIESAQDIQTWFTGYGLDVDGASITADKVKIPRKWADSFSAFERTYVTCLMGAVSFGVLSLLEHRHDLSAVVQPMTHAPFVLAILFLSVVASVLSYIALNRALEVLPVARTAVLINLSTVVSILTGVLILHEPFGWISAVASAAILVGIWGVQRFAAPTPAAGSEPLSLS